MAGYVRLCQFITGYFRISQDMSGENRLHQFT